MRLKLISKKDEVPNVTSFQFESETPLSWVPGQFMRYHLEDPSPDERKFDRFFSIASAPFEQHLMITTRFIPDDGSTFKRDLRHLNIGDSIEAAGPFGSFVIDPTADPNQQYIFIAGGIGITPFRSILMQRDNDKNPINVTLLYANRNPDIIYKTELEDIASRNPGLKIHYIIDPHRIDQNKIQSLTSTLHSPVSHLQPPIYYLSGPEPMVAAIKDQVEQLGIPKDRIKTDYFPGYTSI